jgi:hypothetical protein
MNLFELGAKLMREPELVAVLEQAQALALELVAAA